MLYFGSDNKSPLSSFSISININFYLAWFSIPIFSNTLQFSSDSRFSFVTKLRLMNFYFLKLALGRILPFENLIYCTVDHGK